MLAALATTFMRLRLIWADGGYAGALLQWVANLRRARRIRMQIVNRVSLRVGTIVTITSRTMTVLLTAEVQDAACRRRVSGGADHRVRRGSRAKDDDHTLGFSGTQIAHEHSVVLPPRLARVVLLLAQAAGVSGALLGALVLAVAPPLRWITPAADDEDGATPIASNLPAHPVLVHVRAPSWCARRKELGSGPARVRNTGRTSASHGGLGVLPGPSVFCDVRSAEGYRVRTPWAQFYEQSPPAVARLRRPASPQRSSRGRPTPSSGWGRWSPAIPAKVVPTETGGDSGRSFGPRIVGGDVPIGLRARTLSVHARGSSVPLRSRPRRPKGGQCATLGPPGFGLAHDCPARHLAVLAISVCANPTADVGARTTRRRVSATPRVEAQALGTVVRAPPVAAVCGRPAVRTRGPIRVLRRACVVALDPRLRCGIERRAAFSPGRRVRERHGRLRTRSGRPAARTDEDDEICCERAHGLGGYGRRSRFVPSRRCERPESCAPNNRERRSIGPAWPQGSIAWGREFPLCSGQALRPIHRGLLRAALEEVENLPCEKRVALFTTRQRTCAHRPAASSRPCGNPPLALTDSTPSLQGNGRRPISPACSVTSRSSPWRSA